MNILFVSRYCYPHIGGVEKHTECIAYNLKRIGYKVKTISEEDIKKPNIKIIGLLYIWFWLFKNKNYIKNADIIHIHDVFVWYLPFKFLYPRKKVFITFHGWEGKYPIPFWNILNKKIANYLCSGSISIGKYINKYYKIKSDYVTYGSINQNLKIKSKNYNSKVKNSLIWLGRTDEDTGINEFRAWLKKQKTKYKVTYVSYVKNPQKYLKKAEYCVPVGYLSYLEAKVYGCKIKTFYGNKLKKDYWDEIKRVKKFDTWEDVASLYIKLWKK